MNFDYLLIMSHVKFCIYCQNAFDAAGITTNITWHQKTSSGFAKGKYIFLLQMLHCDVLFVYFVLCMYYKSISCINFLLCCYLHLQMLSSLILNCINVSFIKYNGKRIMFFAVIVDMLGEVSYT